jgi:fermentation-respiration switch protein FrsA (DUF1100 family)
VLLGPLTSVKEQVPGHYADALARRGFVTLAFDNRSFGESGGNPRQYEHPGRKIEDARAALSFLEQRPEVAEASLGAVGVCAGAGYMAVVGPAAPWLMKTLSVAGTAAMFLVGGGIVVHGIGPLHHAVEHIGELAGGLHGLVVALANGAIGVVAGAAVLAGVSLVKRLRRKGAAAA